MYIADLFAFSFILWRYSHRLHNRRKWETYLKQPLWVQLKPSFHPPLSVTQIYALYVPIQSSFCVADVFPGSSNTMSSILISSPTFPLWRFPELPHVWFFYPHNMQVINFLCFEYIQWFPFSSQILIDSTWYWDLVWHLGLTCSVQQLHLNLFY